MTTSKNDQVEENEMTYTQRDDMHDESAELLASRDSLAAEVTKLRDERDQLAAAVNALHGRLANDIRANARPVNHVEWIISELEKITAGW